MDVYTTEDEQVEALKKWWKENGKSVIGGAIIGIGVLFGGRAYIEQGNQHVENASATFEGMMQELAQDKNKEAADFGAQLLGQYSDTPYAAMAAMTMAKIKVDEGDLTTAKTHLRYALEHVEKEDIKHVVRLRLARVLLAEKNTDEALKVLNSTEHGTFKSSYEELKGDIYVATGQVDQARNSYTIALAAMEPSSRARSFLEMKIDDLGVAENPAAKS